MYVMLYRLNDCWQSGLLLLRERLRQHQLSVRVTVKQAPIVYISRYAAKTESIDESYVL